jgi:S1-C subfamily serine protease
MLTEFSNELADVVAAAAPSVVQVNGGRRPASGLSYGKGVVVTTTRALGREKGLQVRQHDGRTADAELAGWDAASGVAVLRTEIEAPALAPSTADVRVGQVGIAIARSWSNAVTASAGIVAVIGGPLRTGRRRAIEQVLRTTAPMHDGFAGGAFLDAAGGLIGVATASSIRGFGVVIPAAIAWKAAAGVLEHGRTRRGYIGIAGQPVSLAAEQKKVAGRESGLLVVNVMPDGPAARAGLMVGDVIVTLNGTPMDSPEQLLDLLMTIGADQAVQAQVLRGAVLEDVSMTTVERPRK